MSRKNRPKKRYNPNKQAFRQIDSGITVIAKSIVYAWVPGIKGVRGFDYEGNPVNVIPRVHEELMLREHKWYALCSLLCIDPSKQLSIKSEEVFCTAAIKHKDLAPFLNEKHIELYNATMKDGVDDIFSLGWVIAPSGEEVPNEVIHRIYRKLGAWERRVTVRHLMETQSLAFEAGEPSCT